MDSFAKLYRKFQGLTSDSATAAAVGDYLEGRHRNPRHWEELRVDVIQLLGRAIGLYCLSELPDSILMWSHYGFEHTGYCAEFEAADTTPVFGAAQPVLYCENYPVVDYFKTPNDEQVDLIFLTKYIGWSYEHEWRIIDHEAGPGLREYPIELMKSVTFGLKMPNEHKTRIREWVKQRGTAIKFYQARQHSQRFAIERQET